MQQQTTKALKNNASLCYTQAFERFFFFDEAQAFERCHMTIETKNKFQIIER